ncbi:MAG: hypothetical protein HKP58_10825 [Desulfatitalea sp.]|nr:mitochondrial fission ELM1 family protein [Desulfatitalea sp.]NNK00893.1 hypothetical protein [Desulfatitalea sp.]
MTPLCITAVLDGRPGHEKQTQAVISALKRMTPVQVRHQILQAPSVWDTSRQWCQWLWPFSWRTAKPSPNDQIDLVIGTGSRVHLPMIRLHQRHGGRLVTCMTPDIILRRHFDLCLVPRHDRPRPARNIFVTIGPPAAVSGSGAHRPERGLILIGGRDPKSLHWHSAAVLKHVEAIVRREQQRKWTISSSPRTPEKMLDSLAQLDDGHANVSFFRSQDTPAGWIEAAYAENSFAWVTADSISMVYEALAAGCQVGILPVQWKKKQNKFQRSIDDVCGRGYAVTYVQWLEGKAPAAGAVLNEAQRCACEILRRWWPERQKSP